MSIELAWFVGAPIVGGAVVTAGIVVPRLRHHPEFAATTKESARVLPLRARATAPAGEMSADGSASADVLIAEGTGEAALSTDEIAAEAQSDPEASNTEVTPLNIARPAFGVRLATGLRRAFRRKRLSESVPGDGEGADNEAPLKERPDDLKVDESARRGLVPLAHFAPEPITEPAALETPPLPTPLVDLEPESQPGPTENGIVDIEVPPGEDPIAWRANVAAREQHLSEAAANAQRVRAETAADEARRQREVEAHDRQIELENIALAEEVRVRSEARARKWYARLDLDLEAPTVDVRMAMASSLATVHAAWAGRLLREAFGQEEDAHVRARLIGALVSGDHLDVTDPFCVAFDNGGVERAAVFEMLMPLRHEAQWIADLLAPLLVA